MATAPASLIIPAGSNSATFTVTTVATGSASIQATATDYAAGSVAVTVRPLSLNLPTGVLVAPGLNRSIPLILSDPAPTGGLVVTLTSGNIATATVPVSITVPEGQTSANFTLTGLAAGVTTVTAAADGYQSANLAVTVQTVTISIGSPPVNSITILPPDVTKTYAITLSRPAPTGGVVVDMAIADGTIASITPVSITIAEGQTSGGLVLATVTGLVKGTTTLTASAAGLN